MKKVKTYDPEEVLMAVIEHYAKNECDDFNESVSAVFIETEDGICVELQIEKESPNRSKKVLN